jgi:hypothetical protein
MFVGELGHRLWHHRFKLLVWGFMEASWSRLSGSYVGHIVQDVGLCSA